jgi:hypothetical protein
MSPHGDSVIVPILQSRRLTLLLVAVVAVHLGLAAVGISCWRCPLRSFTGLECPGCGLTAAILFMLGGNWRLALESHAMAPLAIGGMLCLAGLTALPSHHRQKVIRWIGVTDGKYHLTALTLGIVCVYWGFRIARQ